MSTARIEFNEWMPEKVGVNSVEIAPVSPSECRPGTPVSGTVLKARNAGFRDGDHLIGVITNKVSDEVMIATDWRGHVYMGVPIIVDVARLSMRTPAGYCTFYTEDFTLIEITHRRSAKGRKFAPVVPKAERFARTWARSEKARATRAQRKERERQQRLSATIRQWPYAA